MATDASYYRILTNIGTDLADTLESLLDAHPHGFTFAAAEAQGIPREQVAQWVREGYLYPSNE